jgi:hypothetical protein
MDGDLNAPSMGAKEGGSTRSLFGESLLRELRRFQPLAAASSGLQQANSSNNPMSDLPCESGSGCGVPPQETTEEVWRQGISADAQQETQSLQSRMPLNCWPHECNETVGIWEIEPDIPRGAVGVKNRVDRLRALGNAVVPQIPEIIGRAIMQMETP